MINDPQQDESLIRVLTTPVDPVVALHAKQVGGDHYKTLAVEPWKAIKAWLSPEEWIGFLRGNIIKYQARANSGKGSRIENLEKAGHYQEALELAINEWKEKEKEKSNEVIKERSSY